MGNRHVQPGGVSFEQLVGQTTIEEQIEAAKEDALRQTVAATNELFARIEEVNARTEERLRAVFAKQEEENAA